MGSTNSNSDRSENHRKKEESQEEKLSEDLVDELSSHVKRMNDEKKQSDKEKEGTKKSLRESQQENILFDESLKLSDSFGTKMKKRQYIIMVVAAVAVAFVSGYYVYLTTLPGYDYKVEMGQNPESSYIIQNLKGETIRTWLAWNIPEDRPLYISIVGSEKHQDKLGVIKKVVNSGETVKIDNQLVGKDRLGSSVYYTGWKGAIEDRVKESEKRKDDASKYNIPSEFVILGAGNKNGQDDDSSPSGDIVVVLKEEENADGYAGLTRSVTEDNQILKSRITIYNVDKIDDEKFEAVFRHEFGHALGLAHSSDSDDLMHSPIKTEYPYVSPCDADALQRLYAGNKTSKVVCKE